MHEYHDARDVNVVFADAMPRDRADPHGPAAAAALRVRSSHTLKRGRREVSCGKPGLD
jgi:hypothetical protein